MFCWVFFCYCFLSGGGEGAFKQGYTVDYHSNCSSITLNTEVYYNHAHALDLDMLDKISMYRKIYYIITVINQDQEM